MTTCSKNNCTIQQELRELSAIMRPSEPIPCTMFGIFARLHFLFALFLRRVSLVLHFVFARFVDDSSQTRPCERIYETTELDFCSNPKKCSKAIVEDKTLQRVNLCIEPGGGITFCYDGGSRLDLLVDLLLDAALICYIGTWSGGPTSCSNPAPVLTQ